MKPRFILTAPSHSFNFGRIFSRGLLAFALIAQSLPQGAFASEDFPQEAKPLPAPPAEARQMRLALLDAFVRDYQFNAETPANFERHFFKSLSKKDREDIHGLMKGTENLPSLKREGEAIIARAGGISLKIEVPNPTIPEFIVNGVKWTYSSKQALKPQLGLLMRKIELSKADRNAWLKLLESPAYAEPISGTVILAVVITGVLTYLLNNGFLDPAAKTVMHYLCSTMQDHGQNMKESIVCENWYKEQLNKKKVEKEFATGPKFDQLKELIASEMRSANSPWKIQDAKCPEINGTKDLVYSMRISRKDCVDKPGISSAESCWKNVRFVFSPEGTPKDGLLTQGDVEPDSLDMNKPEDQLKVQIRYLFDKDSNMKGIRVLGGSNALTGPFHDIKREANTNITNDDKRYLDPAEEALRLIGFRVTQCVIDSIAQKGMPEADIPANSAKPDTRKIPTLK